MPHCSLDLKGMVTGMNELKLLKETTLQSLQAKSLGRTFLWFESLSSTNDYLKEHGHSLPHGTAVSALRQLAGRGRTGRRWEDTAQYGETKSLALSVLLKPPTVYHTPVLPHVCGLAVKKALEQLSGVSSGIKWPNDIVITRSKVCGILCESVIAGDELYVVCGMGVNLLETKEEFTRLGLEHATSVYQESGKRLDLPETAAAILNALEGYYERLLQGGFDALLDEYRAACVTVGADVRVLQNGTEQTGAAVDIAADGTLLVNIDGKLCAIRSGEASVRGLYGYV